MRVSRAIKIIAILCFTLIAVSLIVARNSPATGYEPSIYTATPPLVWGGLIFGVICGIGIIFHQLYTGKQEENRLWLVGLLLVALSFITVLSMHVIRSYLLYGTGDSLTHLVYVRDLLSSGHVEARNLYPVAHIYAAELHQILSIDVTRLFGYIPIFFNALYIVFIYLFARSVFADKGQVILATLAGILVLTSLRVGFVYFCPNELADVILPLAFLLTLTRFSPRNSPQFATLLIFMILFFPVFHVMAAFALLTILSGLWIPNRLHNLLSRNSGQRDDIGRSFALPVALCLLVWIIAWISSFGIWGSTILNLRTLIVEGGQTMLEEEMWYVRYADQYGYNVAEQFFKVYGETLVYGLFTLISIPMLLRRLPSSASLRNLFSLYGPLALLSLSFIILFGLNLGFGPQRLLRYMLIIGAMFVGYVCYEIVKKARGSPARSFLPKLGFYLVITALILLSLNGGAKAYLSRYLLQTNNQPAVSELQGLGWFVENKADLSSQGITIPPRRVIPLFVAPQERAKRIGEFWDYAPPPYHFNYDQQDILGRSYAEDSYILLNRASRLVYIEVLPEMAKHRFYPADFERLEHDPSVDKLYDNSGLDVWYVRSQTSGAD